MTTRDMIHETELVLAAAIVAHSANRAYCALLGDDSQVPWEDAPDWQKESILAGVAAINETPDLSPEASHALWFERKAEEGWIHGAEKDVEAKTHPCFLPYDALPDEHRYKDTLFGAVVRAVLFGVSGANEMAPSEDEDPGPDIGLPGDPMAAARSVFGPKWDNHVDCPDCKAVIEIVDGTPQVTGRQNSDEEDIGQPVTASEHKAAYDKLCEAKPLSARDRAIEKLLGEHTVKGVMGATTDGVGGVMVFYHDGSTARYVQSHGWSVREPVPDTYAALFAKVDAAMAEAAKAEE